MVIAQKRVPTVLLILYALIGIALSVVVGRAMAEQGEPRTELLLLSP